MNKIEKNVIMGKWLFERLMSDELYLGALDVLSRYKEILEKKSQREVTLYHRMFKDSGISENKINWILEYI